MNTHNQCSTIRMRALTTERRPLITKIAAMLVIPIILAAFATLMPASRAGATTAAGQTVLVPGSSWAPQYTSGGADLNVYSNGSCMGNATCNIDGSGTFGPQWQCTELAQRWAHVAWGEPDIWMGDAESAWTDGPQLARPLVQHPNGGADAPQFGDLLVFAGTSSDPSGHIAVVSGSSSSSVNIVEQNWNFAGQATLPITGTSMPSRFTRERQRESDNPRMAKA